ncbi:MAG: ABC transporter ATP-binding protein [Candidatus Omnitrophota bacterium]
MDTDKGKILRVRDLTVTAGKRRIVDRVSFDLCPGKVAALVGESGSGKTITALSVLDLLPPGVERAGGSALFNGKNIFDLTPEGKRAMRGNKIAMVFQEPFTSLNPVMRVGKQIREAVDAHIKMPGLLLEKRIVELLEMVKLPPDTASRYPHELSGGMRQRIVLAMALSCGADVMIMDEPTTALDVSIQSDILKLVKKLQHENKFAILFITHDFSIVNNIADEVYVMRQGCIVENGKTKDVLTAPRHAYTRHLLDCIPRLGDKRVRLPV